MDTSRPGTAVAPPVAAVAPPAVAWIPVITPKLLLKALKENSDHVVKSFSASLNLLSQKVDSNMANIASNTKKLTDHDDILSEHGRHLDSLLARVKSLEPGSHTTNPLPSHAVLSHAYIDARRSLWLWPVDGGNQGNYER